MKQYTHDYSLPSEAESKLFDALMECEDKNSKVAILIEQAQTTLRKYLAHDNIVEDPDSEGFIKASDTFDEEDLKRIREILYRAIVAVPTSDYDEANELVELVDVITFGEINGFLCRQNWAKKLDTIEELPEMDDVVLRNEHYGHILNALAESLQHGWKDDDEGEILDTINICLRNYNEDSGGYDSIEDFLQDWE